MLHTTNPFNSTFTYKISNITGWPPNLIPSDFLALNLMSYISANELHMSSILLRPLMLGQSKVMSSAYERPPT